MNPPKVLTAGIAHRTSKTSLAQPQKPKNASSKKSSPLSPPAIPSSNSDSNNNQSSPDRAAGSVPSSPVKTESKLTEPIPSVIHKALSEGLSSQSSNPDIDSLSYDHEEQYVDYDESEEHSETRGLLLDNQNDSKSQRQLDDLYATQETGANPSYHHQDESLNSRGKLIWLAVCFFGIMLSFVGYGLLLEYATSGGRKLHELSFLFVTSLLYTVTAAAGRYVRDETPTTIPPARFAVLGMTSMGSTFCSVRSLRYVIFPIQVLAKSCKPVPVMIMGAFMGKKYPLRKYINVFLIVAGVGLFMGGGGSSSKKSSSSSSENDTSSSSGQIIGIVLLFISLCFDGGTGAYEDKLMAVHSVGPFDLMYNIQLGKTIIAGVSLLVLNQIHVFLQMCQEMGFVLIALGLTGALGQVFIFVTISKFGALTCSIIGLARKVTTLVASIYFYGHHLNGVQMSGLVISVASMVMNFMGKKKGGHGHGHGQDGGEALTKKHDSIEITEKSYKDSVEGGGGSGSNKHDIELPPMNKVKPITAGGC